MSRTYVFDAVDEKMRAEIADHPLCGLKVVHKPADHAGQPSLWPYAITDGKSFGFFESNMILFWGANNEEPIIAALNKLGFYVIDSF